MANCQTWQSKNSIAKPRTRAGGGRPSPIREGLQNLFSSFGDFKVIGEAADGEQDCELAQQLQPDVVLMDVEMPTVDRESDESTSSKSRSSPSTFLERDTFTKAM